MDQKKYEKHTGEYVFDVQRWFLWLQQIDTNKHSIYMFDIIWVGPWDQKVSKTHRRMCIWCPAYVLGLQHVENNKHNNYMIDITWVGPWNQKTIKNTQANVYFVSNVDFVIATFWNQQA